MIGEDGGIAWEGDGWEAIFVMNGIGQMLSKCSGGT